MDRIVFIQYIDAFYFEENRLDNDKFIIHHAVGKLLTASKDSITISFVEKDGIPWRGLLFPSEAVFFDKKNEIPLSLRVKNKINNIKKTKRDIPIGIFWKDIVYFDNGVIPQFPSLMYTEGKLFSVTPDAVIIKNPETINISPGKLADHPKKLVYVSFIIIPKRLVTDIEIYGK